MERRTDYGMDLKRTAADRSRMSTMIHVSHMSVTSRASTLRFTSVALYWIISVVVFIICCTNLALVGLLKLAQHESMKPKYFFYNTLSGAVTWEDPRPRKHFDDVSGRTYYTDPMNPSNKWFEGDLDQTPVERAWRLASVPKGEENSGTPYFFNEKTNERRWDMPESMAWKRLMSDKVFYFNKVTGRSQHERPEEMGYHDAQTGRTYWVDKETGKPTWESEHWWTAVTIGDELPLFAGRTYWVQELTGKVVNEKPEALGWVEWHYEAPWDDTGPDGGDEL